MSRKSAENLLKELEFLFERYSQELRATTQPYYLAKIRGNVKDYKYHPEDILVRETLMEHVGSLPMVATAFYPYIKDDNVDLGKALIMLAIHDIGELMTGDEMTFIKKLDGKEAERQAALKLLHKSYHDAYDDVESQTSQSAKFSKAIDKVTPDIVDYLSPVDITIWRYRHFCKTEPEDIVDLIVKFKRPYMLWSPFMTEFHKLLMDKMTAKIKKHQA